MGTVAFAQRRAVVIPAMVALYLGAIVAANLLATHYGAKATPYIAFALIGADLTTRDTLQDLWGTRWVRLGLLIATGGLLSYLLNADAGKIAVASVVAFTSAAVVDTAIYTALRRVDWQRRVTLSNIGAAAVDSVLFLWIAFGVFGALTFAQFCAKVAGGAVWALALGWRK
jgi:queuosine precursor transporter